MVVLKQEESIAHILLRTTLKSQFYVHSFYTLLYHGARRGYVTLLYLGNWGYFHFTLPQGLNIVGAWAQDVAVSYQCFGP